MSDYMGGHLAGLKPKIRPTRQRDIIPTTSDGYAYKGKEESFEEKDRQHYFLLELYGPQEETKPRRR